jgi:Pyridine nucleotide-disulphide oxidoreductase
VIDYLIVGGGLAGATTAETLRREGAAGSVAILSAEDMAPYHRPRLSKSYLVGTSSADEMLVHPVGFYAAQEIELRLGVRVARVDTQQRQMLLAPGAAPRRSSAAGHALPGIHYLRQRAETDAIRAAAQSGRRAVVIIGASYLGMEVAFSLRELGLSVTRSRPARAYSPFSRRRRFRRSSRRSRASAGSRSVWTIPSSDLPEQTASRQLKRRAARLCLRTWSCLPQAWSRLRDFCKTAA